jgi:chemotaxis protein MotA
MDISTVIGIAAGTLLVFAAVFSGGNTSMYFNMPALMITLGGTFASTLITYPLPRITAITSVVRKAFTNRLPEHVDVIDTMTRLAEKAREQGILSLEPELKELNDDFMRRGVAMVIDGIDPSVIRQVLENEIDVLRERHRVGQSMFSTMALYAPAYGLIGTLIGLVKMLRSLSDPVAIGPGMAVALLSTFYGALFSYLIFAPIAGKLRARSNEETLLKELVIEGIMSIQTGDNPRILETRMKAFVAPRVRDLV